MCRGHNVFSVIRIIKVRKQRAMTDASVRVDIILLKYLLGALNTPPFYGLMIEARCLSLLMKFIGAL